MAGLSGATEKVRRREFLLASGAFCGLGMSDRLFAGGERERVVLVVDDRFGCKDAPSVRWAVSELLRAFDKERVPAIVTESTCQLEDASFYIALGARASELRQGFQDVGVPREPESLTLAPGMLWGKRALLVDGADARGLMYGILELAGRIRSYGTAALAVAEATTDRPANQIRSMSRAFVSDVEDKSWYYDKQFWRGYLAELARSRINRFCLNFGLGY